MNLVGRINIKLSEIVNVFPEPPKAAERDLRHLSSNLTFFRLAGTLAIAGLLFAIRHVSRFVSNGLAAIGLHVDIGTIVAVILIALFGAIWIALIRWWYLMRKRIPGMSGQRLSAVHAFDAFMKLSRITHPGIGEGLSDIRKLALRIFSQGHDPTVHDFVSHLIHLVRSNMFQDLTAEAPTLEASRDHLDRSLVACLEGKELLPPKSTAASLAQGVGIFNPATTQAF